MRDKQNYAFINCNIIQGIQNKDILNNAAILVNNTDEFGKIEAVGLKDSVKIPNSYKMVDLEGKYILPGLINAHIHLFGSGKPMKSISSEHGREMLVKLLKIPLLKAILKRSMLKNILTELYSGVTTIRSMGDFFYLDVKIKKKIANGKLVAPRMIVGGKGISVTGGHGTPGFTLTADSPWEVRKCVRTNIANGVDVIKLFSTGGVLDARRIGDAGIRKMTIDEIAAACDEAHRAGLMVAAHAESTEGVREALIAGVDTIEHGAEMDDEMVRLFKNNPKTLRGYSSLIPTLYPAIVLAELETKHTGINNINRENAMIVRDEMLKGFQRAVREGIKVGLGTDSSVPFSTHYNTWRELECRVKYAGITPTQAIYQATAANAEILGVENETGTIETGKEADFIVVEGNPTEKISVLSDPYMVVTSGNIINRPQIRKIKAIETLEGLIGKEERRN